MSCRQALNVFRSCATSFSSRHAVAHAPAPAAFRRLAGVRCYSAQAEGGQPQAAESKNGESSKSGTAEQAAPESELEQKLKKKEDEVQDLIVRLHHAYACLYALTKLLCSLFLQGRLRYLQADFVNLQRNAAREKEQQRDFAITKFAGDLLETVDVLAMALKSVPSSAIKPPPEASSSAPTEKTAEAHLFDLHQGVEMTHRLLLQTLFKYQVKPFDPTGEKFDPNRHEALYQAPIPGKEPGTVLECQKVGYTIKDRVLRAAQVGVVQESS
jgi:molecular chaperone GrpE